MATWIGANFDAAEWAAWWPALQAALPGERLLRERTAADAAQIDIALVANPPAGSLRGLPGLRLVQSLWAGVDRLLADPDLPREVPIARMVDPAMTEAMAQTALWVALGLQRDFFDYAAQQRDGRWVQHAQRRADEVRVAVLGLGEMGSACARRLATTGFAVTGWSRRAHPADDFTTASGAAALDGVLGRADIVVNLLPLTPATRGFFDAARLARLPRGASLVNLGRGGHVVDADLLAALDRDHLRHAVLDVFHTEPLPPEHRYWTHPRVTVLPHVAAQTDPRSAAQIVAANVRALREGRPIEHLVDRSSGY
ncbi:MAG: glyoxylate/hydroxypyruvate reductase A [Burkholderiaceae bacterium]